MSQKNKDLLEGKGQTLTRIPTESVSNSWQYSHDWTFALLRFPNESRFLQQSRTKNLIVFILELSVTEVAWQSTLDRETSAQLSSATEVCASFELTAGTARMCFAGGAELKGQI